MFPAATTPLPAAPSSLFLAGFDILMALVRYFSICFSTAFLDEEILSQIMVCCEGSVEFRWCVVRVVLSSDGVL